MATLMFTRIRTLGVRSKHLLGLPQRNGRCVHLSATAHVAKKDASQTRRVKHWYEDAMRPVKSTEELADLLCKSVLYEDDGILALNKPSGVPMHSRQLEETPSLDDVPGISVASCFPELQSKSHAGMLVPMFSQNRLHSGVVVLAKHKAAQDHLQKYFRHIRTNKVFNANYWVVTAGVPEPPRGVGEMGVERRQIGSYVLSIRVEHPGQQKRKAGKAVKASYQYEVLQERMWSQASTALVEISCPASKWDSIQLYLLHKLSPVLGDHQYSSRLKFVLDKPIVMTPEQCLPQPQVLPFEFCKRLGLQQDETGHIPLHLHCRELKIPKPGSTKKELLTITAPLPDFYVRTLHSLGILPPGLQ